MPKAGACCNATERSLWLNGGSANWADFTCLCMQKSGITTTVCQLSPGRLVGSSLQINLRQNGIEPMSGNVAIIGGTGFESLPPEIFAEEVIVDTQYGIARALSISNNYVEPAKLYFVSRHGASHGLAPHQINYRANTDLLLALGVKYVFATNAVGSLTLEHHPGKLVLFDDFIDMTRSRDRTYFSDSNWKHIDFTTPYSPILRSAVLQAATESMVEVAPRGTYLCVDGPRFETPAEVRLFGAWGADVVGMTGIPEVVMAKEVGIEYAALGIVTNPGAGLTTEVVSHDQVTDVMASSITIVRELLLRACGHLVL